MCCARPPAPQASLAREVTRALFATALGLGLLSAVANAQVLDENAWVTNGEVRSILDYGGTTYLGGSFSYLGPLTGSCVALDATTGALIPGMPKVNGAVVKTIDDGAGGWIIAGPFSAVDGAPRPGLARIRADMTLDPWAPDYDPESSDVRDIARSGSTLYACGILTDSQRRSYHLVAFDLSTGQLTPWNPHPDAPVLSVAVSGNTVYVGGVFWSVGGQSRIRLAAIDASTGVATPWNPGLEDGSDYVSRIVPGGPTIYVFGTFSRIGERDRQRFAAVDSATGMVTDWNPVHDSFVSDIAVNGQTVYLVGGFTTMGGESRAGIAALDATTAAVLPWQPAGSDGYVSGIRIEGSRILVTGVFSLMGALERSNIAELDASTAAVTGWNPPRFGNYIASLVVMGSRVVVGGGFNSVGGVARKNIAAVDAITGIATQWNPGSDGRVLQLAAAGTQVFVAGEFSNIGGQARTRVAALDIWTGLATAWNPQPDGEVRALEAGGSTVYVGGHFAMIGGQPRSSLAALDVNTGLATPWNPSVGGSVSSLAWSGSTLYVGGQFSSVGTQARSNLAAIDVMTGLVLPWNPGTNQEVRHLETDGSIVYAAGPFTQAGGVSRVGLAAISAATGIVTPWNPGPVNGQVMALAVSNSAIYVGGSFSSIGSLSRANIASLDPNSGIPTSWNPSADAYVLALSFAEARLYVGGGFDYIAGQDRSSLALFALDPPVVQVLTPNGGESLFLGRSYTITWSATDDIGVESVDLQLSRNGPSGHWEPLHTGGNTGSYSWTVTGPASIGQAYLRAVAHDAQGNVGVDQSDAPFTITFDPSDVTAPVVQVLAPNGHETFFIGEERELHWNVTDDVGVQRVDIYLSRSGPFGPWTLLYEDAAPIAYRTWMVTGPAVFDDAYLRVEARDHSGNIGTDMNDIAFTIADQSVPTLIELFHAVATPSGVRLEWKVLDLSVFQSLTLERAATAVGVWSRVNAIPVNDGQLSSVLDLDAATGETQWYRLNGVRRDGRTIRFGPISVVVLSPVVAFGLSPLAPNPTSGNSLVSFAVPVRANVRLTLTDVQGRELAVLVDGLREPGRHTALLDASDLRVGVYFLTMKAEGVKLARRLTVMR